MDGHASDSIVSYGHESDAGIYGHDRNSVGTSK